MRWKWYETALHYWKPHRTCRDFHVGGIGFRSGNAAKFTSAPPTRTEKGAAESSMGCHEMRLHQLGLFKEHKITMTGGQEITINQWLCPDQYKMTALKDLSAQSYPGLHSELWDKEGMPVVMSVTRKPM
jgi:hypothetical protein